MGLQLHRRRLLSQDESRVLGVRLALGFHDLCVSLLFVLFFCIVACFRGGIEMAALSQMKQVNVHVYERRGNGYKRISAFDYHVSPEKRQTIRVIYQGGVHYGKPVATALRLLPVLSL